MSTLPYFKHTQKKLFTDLILAFSLIMLLGLIILFFKQIANYALSIWLGGGIWGVAQGCVIISLYYQMTACPVRFVKMLYTSEIMKILIASVLFILSVDYLSGVTISLVFLAYLFAQAIFLFFNCKI